MGDMRTQRLFDKTRLVQMAASHGLRVSDAYVEALVEATR
jgi:hypothetical protein